MIYLSATSVYQTDGQTEWMAKCVEGSLVGHGFAFEQEKKKNRSGWCGFATSNLCSEISRLYYIILLFAVLYFYSLAQQLFVRILAQPVLFLSVGQIYSPPRTTPDHKSNFTWRLQKRVAGDCSEFWMTIILRACDYFAIYLILFPFYLLDAPPPPRPKSLSKPLQICVLNNLLPCKYIVGVRGWDWGDKDAYFKLYKWKFGNSPSFSRRWFIQEETHCCRFDWQ